LGAPLVLVLLLLAEDEAADATVRLWRACAMGAVGWKKLSTAEGAAAASRSRSSSMMCGVVEVEAMASDDAAARLDRASRNNSLGRDTTL
jgi:hypothetical protein